MNWYKLAQTNVISEKWKQEGIDVSIYESDVISLLGLIIPKGERKQGIGTAVMQDLTNYADQVGKRIELTVGLKDKYHGTTSRGRLVGFYKRFGFVENKGRNKDFTTNASMYRKPTQNKSTNNKENLDFQNIHIDYHNQQNDYILAAIDIDLPPVSDYSGTPVGMIEYSVFNDEVYINNMLVPPDRRRQGIATKMMNKLKEFNSGIKINWGMTTPEGHEFQRNYEKENDELV